MNRVEGRKPSMENIYSSASSSASTTYGNIMTFVKEKIVEYLPIINFADINLSSEIAYVNVRRRLGRSTLREIKKLETPNMTINPRIETPSGDMFLFDVPLTKNYNNIEYGIDRNTLFWILRNRDDGYFLTYKLNRDRVMFDVEITVDTLIQQIDIWKYMMNFFTWERPYAVKTNLEAMLPRKIVKQMGLMSNIDIDNKNSNQIPVMLQMMNRFSRYPITYKMRNGTALDEFFMYYATFVMLTFEDLQRDEVNRKNFADNFYQIRFTCTADFLIPGLFALIGDDEPPKIIQEDIRVIEPDGNHDLIPLFTVNNFFNRYPSVRGGYTYYATTRFKTDAGNKLSDIVNIKCLFDDWRVDVIHRYDNTHIPISTLLYLIILKDGKEIENKDFSVKWNTMDLEIMNPDDDATYQLIIYVNNNLFMEERNDEVHNASQDKPSL